MSDGQVRGGGLREKMKTILENQEQEDGPNLEEAETNIINEELDKIFEMWARADPEQDSLDRDEFEQFIYIFLI